MRITISTLRNWGGAVAVSLPKKLLASLELRAGSEVVVKLKGGNIVLSPARGRVTLAQLEKEQRALAPAERARTAGGSNPPPPDGSFSEPWPARRSAVTLDVLSRLAPLVT